MNAIFTILVVLILIAAVLLTVVVLLQNGKGGGLASNFVAGNQTFGVRQTADILEKISWVLIALIFVFSVAASFSTNGSGKNEMDITNKVESVATEQVPEFPSAPSALAPEDLPAADLGATSEEE